MLRLGLCCTFRDEPIRFANTTVAAASRLRRRESLAKLGRLCAANAAALQQALAWCADHQIGCFRVNSQILPIKTHPRQGYALADLPNADEIERAFRECGRLVRGLGLRTSFHPDQFVVLNSTRPEVVTASLAEIEYQAEVAEWIGADTINIHAGAAGDSKQQALERLARALDRLSDRARTRLTLENDDRVYTPADLLPLCRAERVPLVYDVHHHRCLSDGLSVEEATHAAQATWDREPLFHLSSPLSGWKGPQPHRHHDFIDPRDFPRVWLDQTLTVEVEAKAKEAAVARLLASLRRRTQRAKLWRRTDGN